MRIQLMNMLNKLLTQQGHIFLAPGQYFHPDFNYDGYHQLPTLLKERHNKQLIEQYCLSIPNTHTRLLPQVLLTYWDKLPIIAVHLGGLLQAKIQLGSSKLPNIEMLHQYFRYPLNPDEILNLSSKKTLMASGATQILSCLAPFGHIYVQRAKFMFNKEIQQLIPINSGITLPWNIIEETCHYISRNQYHENTSTH